MICPMCWSIPPHLSATLAMRECQKLWLNTLSLCSDALQIDIFDVCRSPLPLRFGLFVYHCAALDHVLEGHALVPRIEVFKNLKVLDQLSIRNRNPCNDPLISQPLLQLAPHYKELYVVDESCLVEVYYFIGSCQVFRLLITVGLVSLPLLFLVGEGALLC